MQENELRRMLIWSALLSQFVPSAFGQQQKSRFEAGPVFTATTLNYVLDYKLRFGGARFSWNVTPRLAADVSILTNFSIPNTVTVRDGGRAISVEFGPKFEFWKYRKMSAFAKGEIGFLTYTRTLTGVIAPDFHITTEKKTYPDLDLGGGLEFSIK